MSNTPNSKFNVGDTLRYIGNLRPHFDFEVVRIRYDSNIVLWRYYMTDALMLYGNRHNGIAEPYVELAVDSNDIEFYEQIQ